MTIRITAEPHNDTTARFKRTLAEAFPCDARQAIAMHTYRAPLHKRLLIAVMRGGWLIVPATLAALVLTGCAPAAADAPQAEVHQRAIPAGVCPAGHTAVWVDASTNECLKELP